MAAVVVGDGRAVEEGTLRSVTLDVVEEDGADSVSKVRTGPSDRSCMRAQGSSQVLRGRQKLTSASVRSMKRPLLTFPREASLLAGNPGIFVIPEIVTHCSPASTFADLHSTFHVGSSASESYVAVFTRWLADEPRVELVAAANVIPVAVCESELVSVALQVLLIHISKCLSVNSSWNDGEVL